MSDTKVKIKIKVKAASLQSALTKLAQARMEAQNAQGSE